MARLAFAPGTSPSTASLAFVAPGSAAAAAAAAAAPRPRSSSLFSRSRAWLKNHGGKLALGVMFGVLLVAACGTVVFIGPLGVLLVAAVIGGAVATLS